MPFIGPSGEQNFKLSAAALTNSVSITPPANYEISLTSGSGFQDSPISLTPTVDAIMPTTIYVRLKSGLIAGDYNHLNIIENVFDKLENSAIITCFSPFLEVNLY